MKTNSFDSSTTVKYYGIYVLLSELLAYAQRDYIDKIDELYLPSIEVIKNDNSLKIYGLIKIFMNLLSSASTFSFFTLISRVLGYVRDILIAIFLGASIFADAFFVAFRLPNTFRRLFAEGTFNAAFI